MTATILLRSSWQPVNIGDIAHTPGLLGVLRDHLPAVRVILWPGELDGASTAMLRRHFPELEILDPDDAEAIEHAMQRADFMVHGPGSNLPGARQLEQWWSGTGKPFGVFGSTIEAAEGPRAELLNAAAFIFTRESLSLRTLTQAGIDRPRTGFVPDAVVRLDIRDDASARVFMDAHQLEEDGFACFVPRLRRTPYHRIRPGSRSQAWIEETDELNERTDYADHGRLRAAIVRWVRDTGRPAVVVPEMTYQIDIMDELVIDPLPADVRDQVIARRSFWLPDEAASLYGRAAAVVSIECHSPLIALAAGTPAFHLRQPTDTIKGHMYHDLGLSDYVFEIEQVTDAQFADAVAQKLADPAGMRRDVEAARQRANERLEWGANVLAEALARATGSRA